MAHQSISLDAILGRYAGRQRDALLPALWDVQTAFGHISAAAARQISTALRVPVAEVYGVIGFYSMFSEHPQGKIAIHVCTSPSCGLAGSDELLRRVSDELGIEPGETTPDGRYTVRDTTCLGLCDHAPAALVSRRGEIEARAWITRRVPEGVVFAPFHFAEAAANALTNGAVDPKSGIPEFKICAIRLEPVGSPVAAPAAAPAAREA